MAGKVVLNQEQINMFVQDLADYHKEILLGVAKAQTKMKVLNANNNNIFYMKHTSENIKLLLDTVDTEIMPLLRETLLDTNQCAIDMIKIMRGIDN